MFEYKVSRYDGEAASVWYVQRVTIGNPNEWETVRSCRSKQQADEWAAEANRRAQYGQYF